MKSNAYGALAISMILIASLAFSTSSAQAATFYWDSNTNNAGFGTATGTWAAPTTPSDTQGWSTNSAGSSGIDIVTTTTNDALNFGSASNLGAGTITVSGTVDAGNMTFASGSGTITLSGGTINIAATTIAVNNTSNTISSGFTGTSANLTKSGSGTLYLSGANTYSGTTTISGGVLDVGDMSSGALSTNSFLQFYSSSTAIIQGCGTNNRTVGAPGGGGWNCGPSGSCAMGFSARGGKLTINTTSFSLASNFGQPWYLNSSTSDSELEWKSDWYVGGNADRILYVNAGISTNSFVTMSGNIYNGGSGSSIGGFTKNSTGKLVLKGNNAYRGGTTIPSGVINVQNNNGLGTIQSGTSVSSGAALELQGNVTIGAEALTLNGAGIGSGGALRNISGTNTYGGAITLGSEVRINSDSDLLKLDVASGSAITGTKNLTFGGAGDIAVADPIATGTGTVTKDGAGTLTLSGTNTYSGATTVIAGTLSLASESALAGTAALYTTNAAKINLVVDATVTNLFLNGLQAMAGTWGGPRSTAMYKWDEYFSGTKVLTVSAGSGITPPTTGTLISIY